MIEYLEMVSWLERAENDQLFLNFRVFILYLRSRKYKNLKKKN